MILGMSIPEFTLLHVIISLIGIGSGVVAVGGMLASHRLPCTTALFLFTTVLTSVTGFLFPIRGFTPGLGVGIVSCVLLMIALFAYYRKSLTGSWRWIYVVTAIAALYLNAPIQVRSATR
jgi:hypothetical protein